MWQVQEEFEDIGRYRNKSLVHLNADKQIDPYHITYPIIWTGYLNNEKIVIKQKDSSSFKISDYEFIQFPDQYTYLQSSVIKAIDNYLRILD